MTKQKEVKDSCLQCEGDAMLEVRKHASEAFMVMDMLHAAYCGNGAKPKTGTTIVDFAKALIAAEEDQQRLVWMIQNDAKRRTKEIGDLICALKFISDTTRETYSSGANLSSKSMVIPLTETFRVAIHRLEAVLSSDKGLLEGKQPQNQKNFMDCLLEK